MDKERAKEFLFDCPNTNKFYISKNLQTLLDMNDGDLYFIYAVVETESGDTLMNMDWSYSGEPIIMGRFIHKDYLIKYKGNEIINV
jgi:hypothetical protein